MKKINKISLTLSQSKKGEYSSRLSDSTPLGNHESFRVNDSFYRMLVESLTGYGIFTTDKEGNISSWNVGAAKLLGYTEQEIIGKNVSIIFRLEDTDHQKIQKELHRVVMRDKVTIERYHVRKNGSQFWASSLIFSLGDEKDIARGFTFIVRDLTEKLEFEKRQDAFITTATHELKTPITSIKLYTQIVEQEIKKSKNQKNIQSVVELNQQLDKVMALMDYLFDVAKIQQGKLELEKTPFNINILIKDTIATVQHTPQKHTIIHEGSVTEQVYGDRERLGQVLINLINNAIKYSPGPDRIIVSVTNDEAHIIISVKDFGLGISKSEQPGIFGRFYRASGAIDHKIEGIGLGLYVAQQIVIAHKGKMWFKSEKDKGSTFFFSVPRKVITLGSSVLI